MKTTNFLLTGVAALLLATAPALADSNSCAQNYSPAVQMILILKALQNPNSPLAQQGYALANGATIALDSGSTEDNVRDTLKRYLDDSADFIFDGGRQTTRFSSTHPMKG